MKDDPGRAKRMKVAKSTKSDLEKMEAFELHKIDTGDKPDIFDKFFADHSIDIRTGELLGRYIAEERDSNRRLQACRAAVAAQMNGNGTGEVEARLARIEQALDALLAKA